MGPQTRLRHPQGIRFLNGLSEPQRRTLEHVTRTAEVKRRHRIYLPGDPSDRIFLVRAGVVKIAALGPSGRELILAFLHTGDVFGELALVDDAPRDHLAEAHEHAVIGAIGRDVVLQLMRESPELGYQITKVIGCRLRRFRGRIGQLLCQSAHRRVAHSLLDLAEQHGIPDAEGIVIPLRLSQRDIANLVGLTRETVNIILKDLGRSNLIEIHQGSIRLKDPHALDAAHLRGPAPAARPATAQDNPTSASSVNRKMSLVHVGRGSG